MSRLFEDRHPHFHRLNRNKSSYMAAGEVAGERGAEVEAVGAVALASSSQLGS